MRQGRNSGSRQNSRHRHTGNLKDALGGDVLTLEISESTDTKLEEQFETMDWVVGVDVRNGAMELRVRNADRHLPEVFKAAEKMGVTITSVHLRKPTLEDVYLKYTGRKIREQEAGQSGLGGASESEEGN